MDGRTSFRIGDKLPLTLEDEYVNEQARSAQADSYSIIGASVRGRLHYHNNIPRDDAFRVHFDGTWLAVAVADGAGSRPRSRYGASYLANRLCIRLLTTARIQYWRIHNKTDQDEAQTTDIARETSPQNIVFKAFHSARTDLERFAFKHGVGLEELHSTLLGLILNTKTGEMGIGQIGDGLILGLDSGKDAKLLAEPATADEPGASYFVTQADWEQ